MFTSSVHTLHDKNPFNSVPLSGNSRTRSRSEAHARHRFAEWGVVLFSFLFFSFFFEIEGRRCCQCCQDGAACGQSQRVLSIDRFLTASDQAAVGRSKAVGGPEPVDSISRHQKSKPPATVPLLQRVGFGLSRTVVRRQVKRPLSRSALRAPHQLVLCYHPSLNSILEKDWRLWGPEGLTLDMSRRRWVAQECGESPLSLFVFRATRNRLSLSLCASNSSRQKEFAAMGIGCGVRYAHSTNFSTSLCSITSFSWSFTKFYGLRLVYVFVCRSLGQFLLSSLFPLTQKYLATASLFGLEEFFRDLDLFKVNIWAPIFNSLRTRVKGGNMCYLDS